MDNSRKPEAWEGGEFQKSWEKFYYELYDSLSLEDSKALAEYCKGKGLSWCYGWYLHNINEVAQFLSASLDERNKKPEWANNRPRYRLLVLASLWHLRGALAWRRIVNSKLTHGYRMEDFLKQGFEFVDAIEYDILFWPYHEENPFNIGEDSGSTLINHGCTRGKGLSYEEFVREP